ncbi:hypothetical protein COOONC_09639 [Cooperia oncophora]
MCDLFHALDILASTSSIWNLCVISLDRYDSNIHAKILEKIPDFFERRTVKCNIHELGQDPIGYRDKVSKRRILMAICGVWMMSACLSFPAIIWWRTTSPHLYEHKVKKLFAEFRILIVMSRVD